jgi:hypothetical protein
MVYLMTSVTQRRMLGSLMPVLEMMCEEAVVTRLEVLSRYLSGGTEENEKNFGQDRRFRG